MITKDGRTEASKQESKQVKKYVNNRAFLLINKIKTTIDLSAIKEYKPSYRS